MKTYLQIVKMLVVKDLFKKLPLILQCHISPILEYYFPFFIIINI